MEMFSSRTNFDFLGLRKISLAVSAILFVASIGLLLARGVNYALDFTGGHLVEASFEQPVDSSKVREALIEGGFHSPMVQSLGGAKDIAIRLAPQKHEGSEASLSMDAKNKALTEKVRGVLETSVGKVSLKPAAFVGPQVGKELRQQGLIAVIVVIFGIMIYIWSRFELRFSISALAAEIHDTVITLGFIVATGREFDLTALAAVLSVVGYSINDKVVVFDRVREIFRSGFKGDTIEVLNRSVNSTLSRTIMTSVTTSLAVGALYFFGGPAVEGFGAIMLFGILIGTLSSIFFACPVLHLLGVSKRDLLPKAKDTSYLERRP